MAEIKKEEIVEETIEDDNELTDEMLEEFTNGRGDIND